MRRKDIDELSTEMVEWINGERISLEEYEAYFCSYQCFGWKLSAENQ